MTSARDLTLFFVWCLRHLENKRMSALRRAKNWYATNRKRKQKYDIAYRERTLESRAAYQKTYREVHPAETRRPHNRRYYKIRMRDASFRVVRNLRNRIWYAVKRGVKSANTLQLLGCSLAELTERLESQFKPGMSWNNYGPVWHIDHIIPCEKFDLTIPAQQRICFHYTNLQPLFAEENQKKGCRYGGNLSGLEHGFDSLVMKGVKCG